MVLRGFYVGAIPAAVFRWPLSFAADTMRSTNGILPTVHGIPTGLGWLEYAGWIAEIGLLGAVGAAVFWWTLQALRGPEPRTWRTGGLFVVSVALALMVVWVPVRVASARGPVDRSCHNVLRDGRASAQPEVHALLEVDLPEWSAVRDEFVSFSKRHGLAFKDTSRNSSDRRLLWLSGCREPGVVVDAVQTRWDPSNPIPNPHSGVHVAVYDERGDKLEWQPIARDLVADLETRWPGKVRFKDKQGRDTTEAAVLGPQMGISQPKRPSIP